MNKCFLPECSSVVGKIKEESWGMVGTDEIPALPLSS